MEIKKEVYSRDNIYGKKTYRKVENIHIQREKIDNKSTYI